MKNNELNDLFSKHPFILKSLSRMPDINTVPSHQIHHVYDIINKHKDLLKKIRLAYNNYETFDLLYSALIFLTHEKNKINHFCYLSLTDKIDYLKTHNISFKKTKKDSLLIEINSWNDLKLIGSPNWCTYKKDSTFLEYHKTNKLYILSIHNDIFGFSFPIGQFIGYNFGNEAISLSDIEFLSQEDPELLEFINSYSKRNYKMYSHPHFWKTIISSTLFFISFLFLTIHPSLISLKFISFFMGIIQAQQLFFNFKDMRFDINFMTLSIILLFVDIMLLFNYFFEFKPLISYFL